MTKTTVREFDAKGKLVKETITEQDEAPRTTRQHCTCAWARSTSAPYCPAHGYLGPIYPTIWCGDTTSGTLTISGPALNGTITSIGASTGNSRAA